MNISLRDYFAAAAMSGTLAADVDFEACPHDVAAVAYAQADAMCAHREGEIASRVKAAKTISERMKNHTEIGYEQ